MVASVDEVGEKRFYYQDHLGSNVLVLNENNEVVEETLYSDFGKVREHDIASGEESSKYKYTGKEMDNSELYYYGARFYNPEIGRFISADSVAGEITNTQTLNRYVYVTNNPMKYVDPTGNFEEEPTDKTAVDLSEQNAKAQNQAFLDSIGDVKFEQEPSVSDLGAWGLVVQPADWLPVGALMNLVSKSFGKKIISEVAQEATERIGKEVAEESVTGFHGATSEILKHGSDKAGVFAKNANPGVFVTRNFKEAREYALSTKGKQYGFESAKKILEKKIPGLNADNIGRPVVLEIQIPASQLTKHGTKEIIKEGIRPEWMTRAHLIK